MRLFLVLVGSIFASLVTLSVAGAQAPPDEEFPPLSLGCEAVQTDSGLLVQWVRMQEAERYVVRRSRDGAPLSWKASVDQPQILVAGLVDTEVQPGTFYGYTVEVIYTGGRSEPVSCGDALPAQVVDVPTPRSCSVQLDLDGRVHVSWIRVADTADYFVLRRSRNGGSADWLARVDGFQSSFEKAAPRAGVYEYSIEAVNGNSRSRTEPCGSLDLSQDAVDPVAPVSCSARRLDNNTYQISWVRAPQDRAEDFIIRRSRDGGQFWWTGRVGVFAAPTFVNENVPAGSAYRYRVEARNVLGTTASVDCSVNTANDAPVGPVSCSLGIRGQRLVQIEAVPAVNDNSVVYILERSRAGGQFWWAGRVLPPGPVAFYDEVPAGGDRFDYRIKVRSVDGREAHTACGGTSFLN